MKTTQAKRRKDKRIVQLNIEITPELHRDLKVIAALNRKSIREVALEAILGFHKDSRKGIESFLPPELQSLGLEFTTAVAA